MQWARTGIQLLFGITFAALLLLLALSMVSEPNKSPHLRRAITYAALLVSGVITLVLWAFHQ
jgi:hypothetical protein